MTRARVILLVPHHDDLRGLLDCLRSVQESGPVDVLVVDDGSPQPPVVADLRAAYRTPGEVHLDVLEENQGIARALNHGVRRCHDLGHEFIARLDAGDRSRPGRLDRQLAAFDADPALGAVGTWVQGVRPDGTEVFALRPPAEHDEIVRRLVEGNQMVHPSMMMRTRTLLAVGAYPEDLPAAEDFGLVARMAPHTRLANLPEILVDKEIDPNSISALQRRAQVRSRLRVIAGLPVPLRRRLPWLLRNVLLLAVSLKWATRIKRVVYRGGTTRG